MVWVPESEGWVKEQRPWLGARRHDRAGYGLHVVVKTYGAPASPRVTYGAASPRWSGARRLSLGSPCDLHSRGVN